MPLLLGKELRLIRIAEQARSNEMMYGLHRGALSDFGLDSRMHPERDTAQ